MADDIRIKDLQSTASYMESDDYLGMDSLASGTRKIKFAGLMDSEDGRLPTTDKTPRGAIAEHEDDISEIKQSLSLLDFISNVKSPASGTDLNTLKTNAIYQVGNWSQYTNPPTGIGYSGCLIVFVVRSYVLQIAYSDSGKKHRFSYNGGSSWNAWI